MAQQTYPGRTAGVAVLGDVLRQIDPGRPSRAVMGSGDYAERAAVWTTGGAGALDPRTKLMVAEQLGRFDTVGIDCVAMNVNDIVCVGAEPIALLDYIAVEEADPAVCAVAEGLLWWSGGRLASRSPGASSRWSRRW